MRGKNIHIHVLTDNICAVSYITNFGGCRSLSCHNIARDIWLWALQRNVWITVAPGKTNTSPDFQSRNAKPDCEWKLNPDIFAEVVQLSFSPEIDLFASRLNYQIMIYVSFHSDPHSLAVDAFSLITWQKCISPLCCYPSGSTESNLWIDNCSQLGDPGMVFHIVQVTNSTTFSAF